MTPHFLAGRVCDCCGAELFVSFKRADGRMSQAKRWARGAVQVAFAVKVATHSHDYESVRKSFCVECAGDALMLAMREMAKLLKDPTGVDPPRKLQSFKPRCPALSPHDEEQCLRRTGHRTPHSSTHFSWAQRLDTNGRAV